MNDATQSGTDRIENDAAKKAIAAIGHRIRELRKSRGLTLQALADASGISSSMLSLVERGLAAPSIGTLILVKEALGIQISDLFEAVRDEEEVVVRSKDAVVSVTPDQVVQRILRRDQNSGVWIVISEYAPGRTAKPNGETAPAMVHGLMLEGSLTVDIDDRSYALGTGDLITYRSEQLKRMRNETPEPARTLWLMVEIR